MKSPDWRPALPLAGLAFLVLLSGCTHASDSSGRPASGGAQAAYDTSYEWKPGTHKAAVFDRILAFRIREREKFETFAEAYAASHGDVAHPRLARLKSLLLKWFSMSENDYTDLPAYMKAFYGTGPYRRLITKPGYSYLAGTVFLPCNAARLHPNFEVAFAYVGGWGTGAAGKAVDAGFQRSNAFDDYAAFVRAQGFPQISKEPRFVCGHPVNFHFYAASDTELRLWARGYTERGRVENVVAILRHPASYGWPPNGGGPVNGIVLKRMTTIGQNDARAALPAGVAWDADGSYFGVDPANAKPRIHWWNLAVGRVDTKGNPIDVQPWGVDQSDETFRAGLINYPQNPATILFTCTGCPNEMDAISLLPSR